MKKTKEKASKLMILILLVMGVNSVKAGCNFAITNVVNSGNTYTFTLGQGPWGAREYIWNFGDGTIDTSYSTPSNISTIVHTFPTTAVYNITIVGQNVGGGGCIGNYSYSITVNSNCQANFNYSVDSLTCLTNFNNTSTGNNLTYQWYNLTNNVSLGTNSSPLVSLSAGTNTILLKTYSNGNFCDSIRKTVYVACNNSTVTSPCQSACSATQIFNPNNTNCWQFNNQSTGINLSYLWQFGDGSTSNLASPQHCYNDNLSSHTALLFINGANCTDSSSVFITDSTNITSCTAQFAYWIDSLNCKVNFYNVGSNFSTYSWYAGGVLFSNQLNPVVSYSALANNQVKLVLYNSNNLVCDSITHPVYVPLSCGGTVAPTNCQSAFVMVQDTVNPSAYFLYDQSVGSNLSYLWNFGDGTSSTLHFPTHTYSQLGNYTVCLTVSSGTCSSQYCLTNYVQRKVNASGMKYITVLPGSSLIGIREISNTLTIGISPNPAYDKISLETNKPVSFLKLVDVTGKTIMKSENIQVTNYTLDVSELEKGVYFIEVHAKDGSRTVKKIIKA